MDRRLKKLIGFTALSLGVLIILASVFTGMLLHAKLHDLGLKAYIALSPDFNKIIVSLFQNGFLLGISILIVGAVILSDAGRERVWLYCCLVIFAALTMSFIPIIFGVDHSSWFFIINGFLIIFCIILFSYFWALHRHKLEDKAQVASDLKMAGYLFFIFAMWKTCMLIGIPDFLLYPEKVIQFNSIHQAIRDAKVIMSFFILGWIFTVLGYYYNNKITPHKKK
jgi:hypothetical protein